MNSSSLLQQTLQTSFTLEGVGIHTGAHGRVTVLPAEENTGRVFRVGNERIPARIENVVDTTRCTVLGVNGVQVSTVEHLLSALCGLGVDNALIEVDGPEIPILDGSALPFAEAILAAQTQAQDTAPRLLTLNAPLEFSDGGSAANVTPAQTFELEIRVDFADWPEGAATVSAQIGQDDVSSVLFRENYCKSIAPARTFAFRKEVEWLLKAGLARGGSLDNALIITPPTEFSTPLRLPEEWARHKLLDAIGDLALLDARLAACVHLSRPGHRFNAELARRIHAASTENASENN